MIKRVIVTIFGFFLAACAGCASDTTGINIGVTPSKAVNDSYTEVMMQLETEEPLEAVLTLPKTSGKPPVVIMLQGSGPQDKDETIYQNKPFRDIAQGLAQRGIASFRFDKRTLTYGDEYMESVTVEDEVVNDALAAIRQMKNDSNVGNVYILGHSLGGMLAPYIAQQSEDVEGVVILAGSPRRLQDIIYDQNMEVLENANLTQEMYDAEMGKVEAFMAATENPPADGKEMIAGAPQEYWASLNAINTPEIAKNLEIPMLILQGDADFQVSVENDYNAWQKLLDGQDNVQFKLYENLNHLFMESNGKRDASDYEKASTVDPQVTEDIATFIKETEKSGAG